MNQFSDLIITYTDLATGEDLVQLAKVQVDAIWERDLQVWDADYQEDIELTMMNVENFLDTNPDYHVIIAHAAHKDNPDHKKVVGYNLAAPYLKDPTRVGIDQFYALPYVDFGKNFHDLRPFELGNNMLKLIEKQVANKAEIIEACPLFGSEKVYHKRGYRRSDNGEFVVKNLNTYSHG